MFENTCCKLTIGIDLIQGVLYPECKNICFAKNSLHINQVIDNKFSTSYDLVNKYRFMNFKQKLYYYNHWAVKKKSF